MIGILYFIVFYALQLLYCRHINRRLVKLTGKWRPLTDDNYPLWFVPFIGFIVVTIIAGSEYFENKAAMSDGKLSKWFNSYDLKK